MNFHVSMPFTFTLDQLENVAEGIEEGEIEGGFVLKIPAVQFDALPASLVKRLGAFVERIE